MAKRSQRPLPESKVFNADALKSGIRKIDRRIQDLTSFDVGSIQKLFKQLSDGLFNVDESGRTFFYPWYLGKGYIVHDKKTETKIRTFIVCYHACFSLVLAFLLTGYTFRLTGYIKYSLMLLVPIFIVWPIGIKSFTRTLEATEKRFTFSKRLKKRARDRSRASLLLTTVIFVVLLAVSIRDFIAQKSIWNGFFVVSLLVLALENWYVLKLKDN